MSALLDVQEVSYGYGPVPVLKNLSLSVGEGARFLLIGPSGSGKSTLINLICGFLRPRSGTILVAGKTISQGSEAARDAVRREHLAVVFQNLRLVEALDISTNLELAGRLAGRKPSRQGVDRMLDELGIAEQARKRPRELSQGEAQRAAIARALIVKPDLLIADEPTSALDDQNAERVARLLLELSQAHGTGLLVATHDKRLRPFFPQVVELHIHIADAAA